jgi:hypothetical protein
MRLTSIMRAPNAVETHIALGGRSLEARAGQSHGIGAGALGAPQMDVGADHPPRHCAEPTHHHAVTIVSITPMLRHAAIWIRRRLTQSSPS